MSGGNTVWGTAAMAVMMVVGCGRVVPTPRATGTAGPKKPAPSATAEPSATAAASAAPAVGPKAFGRAWSVLTKPFNKGVAMAPSGHVGVLGSRHLSLHKGATGEVVGEADVCFTFENALGFVDDKTAALVCENGVKLFQLPTLSYRGVRGLSGVATGAAFAKGKLALSFETGPVKVLSTGDWSELTTLPADQRVTALTFSDDGSQVALGLEQGEVLVYALSGGKGTRMSVKRGLEVASLAFSPDGAKLFAAAGPVSLLFDVATHSQVKRFRSVAGVRRAGWLSADELVVAGKEGLLLLRIDDGVVKGLSGAGAEPFGLAVAPKEQVVCEAQREGKLSCLSRGSIPVSRRIPVGDEPGGAGALKTGGRVMGITGSRLQVKAHPRARIPEAGVRVQLLRYTEQVEGPLRTARWLHLADAQVTKVKDDVIHLRLTDGVRPVPGVRDPLVYDTPVTLAWKMGSP